MRRLLLVLVLALTGCPKSEGPSEVCKKVGEQCRLNKNVLGVCNEGPTTAKCLTQPCLVCASQH